MHVFVNVVLNSYNGNHMQLLQKVQTLTEVPEGETMH